MSISIFRHESEVPAGVSLTDCAVSGGTLSSFLSGALAAAQGRLCVRISPIYMEFPLPCPSGTGRLLSPQEARARLGSGTLHISRALCTGYFTFLRDGKLWLMLYDTPETLEQKLACCRACGVPYVLKKTE